MLEQEGVADVGQCTWPSESEIRLNCARSKVRRDVGSDRRFIISGEFNNAGEPKFICYGCH
jgi:hypothetical protein